MALLASGVGHARTAFPVESRPIGGDESFFRLAETSESPVEYMGRLPPRNPRIEEGRFDEESGLLRYKVRNDDVEPGRDFFFLAKILDFDWSYIPVSRSLRRIVPLPFGQGRCSAGLR